MTALIESRRQADPPTGANPGKYKQIQAYADAKLLALMCTYAEARRHEGEGLTFNADAGAGRGQNHESRQQGRAVQKRSRR